MHLKLEQLEWNILLESKDNDASDDLILISSFEEWLILVWWNYFLSGSPTRILVIFSSGLIQRKTNYIAVVGFIIEMIFFLSWHVLNTSFPIYTESFISRLRISDKKNSKLLLGNYFIRQEFSRRWDFILNMKRRRIFAGLKCSLVLAQIY